VGVSGAVVAAVARRPSLWPTAIRTAATLAPRGWWRRPPFLPVPDRAYLRFRAVTQYGDADRRPDPDDVIQYLTWCATMRAVGAQP
jgi:hypothetical protein